MESSEKRGAVPVSDEASSTKNLNGPSPTPKALQSLGVSFGQLLAMAFGMLDCWGGCSTSIVPFALIVLLSAANGILILQVVRLAKSVESAMSAYVLIAPGVVLTSFYTIALLHP